MKYPILKALFFTVTIFSSLYTFSQQPETWTKDQLIEPSELAEKIKFGKDVPVIISVGPDDLIPGSISVGAAHEKRSLEKFKKELKKIDEETAVVIYCGCCPFAQCPNVRPAIAELKKNNFSNFRLLNIPQNIRVDWINKGYPVN